MNTCTCRLFILFIAVFGLTTGVQAAGYDVILDVSRSMQGFKASPQSAWPGFLSTLETQARKKYRFGDNGKFSEVDAPLAELPLGDLSTYLGDALARWLAASTKGDAVVLITDNQAAPGRSDAAVQQQLMEDLLTRSDSSFSHVGVMALRLPFSGPLWSPDNAVRDNLKNGTRALVAYILGRSGIADGQFRLVRDQVTRALGAYDHHYFQIRPFDATEVGSDLGNIELRTSGKQAVDVRLQDGRLWIKDHPFGETLNLKFKADIKTTANALEMRNVHLDVALQFDDRPDLTRATTTGNPPISATVYPDIASFAPNAIKNFDIEFKIDRFKFSSQPFAQQVRQTMHNSARIDGLMKLNFQASKDSFRIDEKALDEWNYDGPPNKLGRGEQDVQRRVYRLANLIGNLIQEKIPLQTLKAIPVTLEMRYPLTPLLIVLAMVFAALGLLWFFVHGANRGARFVLEDDYGEPTRFAVGLGQRYAYYGPEGRPSFSLRYLGFTFWASSPYSLQNSRFISAGQSLRIYDSGAQEEWSFRLTREDSVPARGDPREIEWD